MTSLDHRTPVLVGVGQASERIDDAGYRGLSPVELAAHAARAALADTGADADRVTAAIDTVAATRQFEISTPISHSPLGRSNNFPRSVAARLGAAPKRAILEVTGGQSPQRLVNELAGTIASGGAEVALVFGSEAISTERHLGGRDDKPDWSEHVDGDLEDRGFGLQGLADRQMLAHGLLDPTSQYALFENARRARTGLSREAYAQLMGTLFEPFTKVAAANPHAAAPVERSAGELVTPTERNRPIVDPYPRFLIARDQVNQGAAVLLTSVGKARELGIPEEKWVFLHGHADLREQPLLEREDLSAAPAAVQAVRHALDVAGIGTGDLATIDLYSCFPVAVFAVCDGLDLAIDDPRGLTVTGGLPFFGGPGNNYSMHAIAGTVERLRAQPGAFGLVGANGGMLSKYSAGVYSTTPAEWRPDRSAELQTGLDARRAVPTAPHPDGWATVETYTVQHAAGTGVVIGRLDDGRRFMASTKDEETLARLLEGEPIGSKVFVRSFGFGNRLTATAERMDERFPLREPGFRDDYEYVRVRRDGHLLEVTINRPDLRNSLHPPANAELDEIFDAYFADPDLWVAIITGAGDKAFSAGNDLVYSASGKPMWVPKNGFAGLTNRESLPKPVIAAVNGFALGGGCEIALACHLVVAAEDAQFGLPEVRVGLVAAAGGLVRLPRAVPPKLANDMILTGRRLGAAEAESFGLVSRVAPAGKALAVAREVAAAILEGSPTSVRTSLRIMAEADGIADTVEAVRHPSPALDELLVSQDAFEGPAAFAQKRKPVWRNR